MTCLRKNPASFETSKEVLETKAWRKDGRYHRIDGPAVITYYTDGQRREEWYIDGKRNRGNDSPAVIFTSSTGDSLMEWWKDGKRDRESGPALIEKRFNGMEIQKWYSKGVVHRPGFGRNAGPAITTISQGEITEEWFDRGIRHRSQGDYGGPAVVKRGGYVTEENYYTYGKLDREDGPAIIVNKIDGGVVKEYYIQGKRQSPIDRVSRNYLPAYYEKKNDVTIKEWYDEGRLQSFPNREGELIPARIETGQNYESKMWYDKGALNSPIDQDGHLFPAVIKIVNEITVSQEWYLNGERHRPEKEGPAIFSEETGGIVYEEWWQYGIKNRSEEPAEIITYPDGDTDEIWWQNGKPLEAGNVIPRYLILESEGVVSETPYGFSE